VARLREQPAIRDAALLRAVGARHLSRFVFFPGKTAEACFGRFCFRNPAARRASLLLPAAPTILAGSNSTWVSPRHPLQGAPVLVSPTDNLMLRALPREAT
jgi:hypothetical protein